MAEMTVRIEGDVPVISSGSTTLKVQEYYGDTSLHAAGSATNVTPGQIICQLTNPPAGFYRVDVHRMAGGSGTPTLYNNGRLWVGSTPYVLTSTPTLDLHYEFTFYVKLDGATNLSVDVVGAGASNITVVASITATRIS
jgi:hypothetical protein